MNHAELVKLKKLSKLMDSQFTGPLGFKFGLDGLLGFVPIVGDLTTTLTSVYIILSAARSGCSTPTLLRMTANVMIDNLLDVVPFLGNVADFFWRSNDRNIALFESHLKDATQTSRQSWLILITIIGALLACMGLSIYVAYRLIQVVLVYLQSFNVNG